MSEQKTSDIYQDPLFQMLSQNSAEALAPVKTSAIPDAEMLNSLILLNKVSGDPDFTKKMAKESVAYLKAAKALLDEDDDLRIQMGGSGFAAVLRLANSLRSEHNEFLKRKRFEVVFQELDADLGVSGLVAKGSEKRKAYV